MKIRIRLLLMKEIEHKNSERIKAFTERRKRPLRHRQRKPMRNREGPDKKP